MNFIEFQYYQSPLGELKIGSYKNKICLCDWNYRGNRKQIDERVSKFLKAEFKEQNNVIIQDTINELENYFNKGLQSFTIPILFCGTDFQKSVWQFLQAIPYGKTNSYAQMARSMNNPLGIRAIAGANGANAISIIVPCHRIIGSKGELVGYAGGLKTKKRLLLLENAINNTQMSLF